MTRSLASYAARLAAGWDDRFGADRSVVLTGALVKVDLSGFTRLSERLARASRFGAEELNDVLNDVFGGLIDIAHGHGGDIVQFGGDALLVWYEGDDAPLRAATATWLQQRSMRDRPAERTPAGPVRLRMSAGVASGRFAFSVIGTEHRELVVHGADATRTLALERIAPSGSVLVDATTLAVIGSACCRRAGSAHRLIRPPTARTSWDRLPLPSERAAEFVPAEVREIEAAGPPSGEHRRAVGAFVALPGLDASTATDPVVARDRLDAVAAAIERACAAYGVCWTATDVAEDGAVFLLFAGAPVTRERDDERMLRACRDVLDAIPDLPIRIGVNGGPVFAGDIGAPDRRTYAIIGDTTNLAARLMVAADPGTVRVSKPVLERAGSHTWTDLGVIAVKGRRDPISVGMLGAERPTPVHRRTHDLPMLGREPEMAVLGGVIDRALDGVPSAVAVVGDAGVGKSRLLAEVLGLAEPRGVRTVVCAAVEEQRAVPFAAIRPALLTLLGSQLDRLAEVLGEEAAFLPLLAAPLGISVADTPEVTRLDDAFVEQRRHAVLTAALARAVSGPTLLAFEDAHWSDRASLAVLGALAASDVVPLGVVVTTRPGVPALADTEHWSRLDLAPLTAEAARGLVLAAAGDQALTDARLERVVLEAHGNALFLRELARAAPATDGPLPESADEVIAARIDTLPAPERSLLRHAAVAGSVTSLELLGSVLDDPDVAVPARWATLDDFVVIEAGALRFRHDLYRRGAAHTLSIRRRRAIHGRVADALLARHSGTGATSFAALVALHLHGAGRYDEAFEWSVSAARRARDDGAFADAADLFDQASDAADRADRIDPAAVMPVVRELAEIHELVGHYDRAIDAIGRIARTTGWTCELLVMRATALERAGRAAKALRVLRRAERTQATAAEHTDRLLCTSSTLGRLGRLRDAYEAANDALAIARELGDGRRQALALLRLEMFASELGDPVARDHGSEALDLLSELGDDRNLGNVLLNMGVTAKDTDDWQAAVANYLASADAYARAGDAVGRAFALNNLAEIRLDQGQLDRAERDVLEARRIFRANGQELGAAATMSSLGTIAARRGRDDEARSWLTAARAELAEAGADLLVLDAALRQVENEVLVGDGDAARRFLVEASAVASRLGDIGTLALGLRRWQAVLDADETELAGLVAAARSHDSLLEVALGCDALAMLAGRRGDAAASSRWRRDRDEIADALAITSFSAPAAVGAPGE